MKFGAYIFTGVALIAAGFVGAYLFGNQPGGERRGVLDASSWERLASPGALSEKHAFLKNDCAACHTSAKGPEAGKCIACHATDAALLQRQTTAFHAGVGTCRECHPEHRGIAGRPIGMDHAALAEIGLRQLSGGRADSDDKATGKLLAEWIDRERFGQHRSGGSLGIAPEEAVLNCAACHSNKDRHAKLFGQDCAQCHSTGKWTIPEFRHPSPASTECAQCHQAPPSHYMMHFSMISAKVAGKPKARVNECYHCHQTTVWNDIKGVGMYKHH